MPTGMQDVSTELKARFRGYQPLPERIARNRWRIRAFVALYVPLSGLLLAVGMIVGVFLCWALLAVILGDTPPFVGPLIAWIWRNLLEVVAALWLAFTVLLAVFSVAALFHGESRLLGKLRSIPAPMGDYREARGALHDVAVASGLRMPRLAIMPDDALNAFIISRDPRIVWIGATTGLLEALSRDEVRAVFAHLIGRVPDGSARTSTILAELLDGASRVRVPYFDVLAPFHMAMSLSLGIAAGLILGLNYQKQVLVAQCGDADALLLTRDPRALMGALEKVLPADNRPGTASEPWFRDEIFGGLFFAWPVYSFADDPELVRLERMREVVGAAAV